MHILIIAQYYEPEPIPKPVELAQSFKQRGHEVCVVTGFPNYPSGRLYPGYRLGLLKREKIDGVEVLRTYEFPYHGQNLLGRIFNYLSFMLSAPLAVIARRKFDLIYVWHPPMTIGVAAWILSKICRAPFLYDIQDIWPETPLISGLLKPGSLTNILYALERFVYGKASHLLAVTQGAKRNLVHKGVPPDKISILPQWVDEGVFKVVPKAEVEDLRVGFGWKNRFVIVFAGNVGRIQGLDVILHAAARMRNSRVLFAIIGEGNVRGRLKSMVKNEKLEDHVAFLDRQPSSQMSLYFAAADALLVSLKKSELSEYVIPTKTYAYMSAARPLLMATGGAGNRLIESARAGLTIDPEDSEALAAAARKLMEIPAQVREQMGHNALRYFQENFMRSSAIPQYEQLFEGLVRSHREGTSPPVMENILFRDARERGCHTTS